MATDDMVKPVSEWHSVRGYYQLTPKQMKRRRKGEPLYERDKVVEPYKYSKGEFV